MNTEWIVPVVAGIIAGLFALGSLAAIGFGIKAWTKAYADPNNPLDDEKKAKQRGMVSTIAGIVVLLVSACCLLFALLGLIGAVGGNNDSNTSFAGSGSNLPAGRAPYNLPADFMPGKEDPSIAAGCGQGIYEGAVCGDASQNGNLNSGNGTGNYSGNGNNNPTLSCIKWSDFVAMADGQGVYELIDALDLMTEVKIDHPESEGAWRVTDNSIVISGFYVDDTTLGGNAEPINMDGQTGAQLITGPVTVPTAGAEFPICDGTLDSSRPASAGVTNRDGGTVEATDAVDTALVIEILNTYKDDPNTMYRLLDELADQNPKARLRFGGSADINAYNSQTIVWSQSGTVSGPVLELDRTETKSIWLVTANGNVHMGYAFSGLNLTEPLDPIHQIVWWPGFNGN